MFASMLKNKRIENRMNKKQVARALNITPMYYARFENGHILPTRRNVKMFADFLGISEDYLLDVISQTAKQRKRNN